MLANYHTHTPRCHHAQGEERAYVERALEGGLKILGFSDHTPYPFTGTDFRSHIRMDPEELADYGAVVNGLRQEYAGRLEIHLGVEAEYYPKFFPALVELLRSGGVEYMILGQHFLHNEMDAAYCGRPTNDKKILETYCGQSIEAMETGLFTYFAHPDLIHFLGDDDEYRRQARRLCRAAVEHHLPMEINLLGLRALRHYPNEMFWQVASEEGVTVILGSDAHLPQDVWDQETEQYARSWAADLGLRVIDRVELVSL